MTPFDLTIVIVWVLSVIVTAGLYAAMARTTGRQRRKLLSFAIWSTFTALWLTLRVYLVTFSHTFDGPSVLISAGFLGIIVLAYIMIGGGVIINGGKHK